MTLSIFFSGVMALIRMCHHLSALSDGAGERRQRFSASFSLWTREQRSLSAGCLSAVPRCLERAPGPLNSQPIFCPSRHFIPAFERRSGPHTVTFLTYLTPRTLTILKKRNKKILSALLDPQQQITFSAQMLEQRTPPPPTINSKFDSLLAACDWCPSPRNPNTAKERARFS